MRRLALVPLALVLTLAGCSAGSRATTSNPPPAGAPAAANAPDAHDQGVLKNLDTSLSEWNATTGPVVKAFRDPSVSAEAFVKLAQPTLPRITSLAREIARRPLAMHDSGLAEVLARIGRVYQAEAVDYGLLIEAAGRGDQAAQMTIATRLSSEGQQNGTDIAAAVSYVRRTYGNEFADAFASGSG